MIGDGMLEEKAKELGRIIGQSPEYQAVKKSSEALNGDRNAVSVLQQMEKLRVQAQQMIQRGDQPTPELEQQLDDLLMKVQGNSAYQRAIAAQENFDKVMYQVNNWIMEGMKKGATSSIITLS
ncbi:MAG TPA: YlbF family regulator [Gemmatimonadaceae bacterium]|nr:YlbF family regulator [Gemmatimonadaceae bacterium]